MKLLCSLLVALCPIYGFAQKKLKSPADFLGYTLGEQFTFHHKVVDYFAHVDSSTANTKLYRYGSTYEGRPLVYMVITSPGNFGRLEQIRQDNWRRAGEISGPTSGLKIPIVWLSYNVHGNEASSTEAAMETLYALAAPDNEVAAWLEKVVVVIDPCLNPDGRERYTAFYRQFGNNPPNPHYDAAEHQEPWPGGRSNHYLFDLNRDWAWLTQKESQHRIVAYHDWFPHVHVDFHEQGFNNPYYFAPAAEPMHNVISTWQRDFQKTIGKNNARHFDKHGWLYFTREVFDLYYPSYGDTYPTYNGAIGMTYEQAGGGAGGLSVITSTGEPLTLAERISHHHASALATIEVTADNAEQVVDEFARYFTENNNHPRTEYKTYVVKADNHPDRLLKLTQWLDAHHIRYGHPSVSKSFRGFHFPTQTSGSVTVKEEDLIVSVYQPKSRFITAVFEPHPSLPDSLTYDITAWNPFYAAGLNAWALTDRLNVGKPWKPVSRTLQTPEAPYAYIFKYGSLEDVAFLVRLHAEGITVRAALQQFSIDGETFKPGSLIITRRNNESIEDFDEKVLTLARRAERIPYTSNTGLVETGTDFGSRHLQLLRAPQVAVLFGEQTSSLSAGEVWHFFEQQINYPLTQLRTGYLRYASLSKYDVIIVPEGQYRMLDDAMTEIIGQWVERGGKLIVIGNAMNAFIDKKGFGLRRFASDSEQKKFESADSDGHVALPRYDDRERKQLSETISGAVYKVSLDTSHPLAFGLDEFYFTLKTHGRRYAWLENGWNVAYFGSEVKPVQGFAGYRANQRLKNSLQLGVYERGGGYIIYFVDNPLFRGFWESGKLLFSNAVFLVND